MDEERLVKFILAVAGGFTVAIVFGWATFDEFMSAWTIGIPALFVGAFFFGRKKD